MSVLDELRTLEASASPTRWEPVLLNDISDVSYIEGTPLGHPAGKPCASFPDGEGGWVSEFEDETLQEQIHADARLIAAARNVLPVLLDIAESALEHRPWCADDMCPLCAALARLAEGERASGKPDGDA